MVKTTSRGWGVHPTLKVRVLRIEAGWQSMRLYKGPARVGERGRAEHAQVSLTTGTENCGHTIAMSKQTRGVIHDSSWHALVTWGEAPPGSNHAQSWVGVAVATLTHRGGLASCGNWCRASTNASPPFPTKS